ncbi:MAG TPA: hypothetical protein DD423_07900 [Opitutae bacterium]|nr:hypothetical protein [Opitutae bacterium]
MSLAGFGALLPNRFTTFAVSCQQLGGLSLSHYLPTLRARLIRSAYCRMGGAVCGAAARGIVREVCCLPMLDRDQC